MISAKNAVLLALAVGISVALGCLLLTALTFGDCESPPPEPQEPIQYPNQEETTVAPSEPTVQYSSESVQYHSVELPETGGLRI